VGLRCGCANAETAYLAVERNRYSDKIEGSTTVVAIAWEQRMISTEFNEIFEKAMAFRDERKWGKFHTIRHLTSALSIEASELQELLLWKTDEDVTNKLADPDFKENLSSEVADILLYLMFICDKADVNLLEVTKAKLALNGKRFPPEDFLGTFSRKNRREID
jgi:NTP pyrophosphatase (non-canonical NTP hydrolase)